MENQSPRFAIAYDCLFPYTTGGGERQYRAFAQWLVARGNQVDYLTAAQWEGEPDAAAFAVVPVVGRLRLYDEEGVRRSPAALTFAVGLFRALRRRRHRYDAVVVSGLPVLNVFAARLALWGSGTALVVDYLEVWGRRQWSDYAGAAKGTLAWVLQRVAIALTPTATAHSALTARRLRREGLRGRLLVSPGLIDPEPSEIVHLSAAAEPQYVLYAGRHIPDKRVECLPAAVAYARRSIPGLRLVILGDGPSSAAIDSAIAAADASAWTSRRGFVEQTELADAMAGAAVLVNPSQREGYGLVVVEAAAHGTPTVLVHGEGNASTELIEDGVNGIVSSSTDPAELGQALADAVSAGPALRASTRAWYEEALRTRTVEKTVDAILDALRPDIIRRANSRKYRKQRTEGRQ